MKYLILFTFAFCSLTFASAQQKASRSEVASVKKAGKLKRESDSGRLYLLSVGKSTSKISKEEFENLNKKNIDYVRVLKDPALTSMYGGEAKNGVVLIVMKGAPVRKRAHRQGLSRRVV